MAKLPDIQYLTPTESLGRQDVGLPGRLARQQMALIAEATDIALNVGETIMQQQVNEGVAGAQSELQSLKNTLTRNRTVNVEAFDLVAGVDYNPTAPDGSPVEIISSHQVMEKQWAQGVKDIVGRYTQGLSPGQRRNVQAKLAGAISKMGETVGKQAHMWRMDEINGLAEEQVRKLTQSATFEIKDEIKMQVASVYNDMVKSGFMGAEEGYAKISKARANVDYNVVSQYITDGDQAEIDEVLKLLSAPAENSGLEVTLEQRRALYTQLHQRQSRLEANREKVEKLERERRGNEVLIDIRENGAKDWGQIRAIVRDLEPSTARLVIGLNEDKLEAAAEEDEESDETIRSTMMGKILDLSVGKTEGMDIDSMADAIINEINDLREEHKLGRPGLTPDDAAELYGRIAGAKTAAAAPREWNALMEHMSRDITRGSIASHGTRNNAAQIQIFNRAVEDLREFRDAGGQDYWGWWYANRHRYEGYTTEKNVEIAEKNLAKRFQVLADPGDPTRPAGGPYVNYSESIAAVKAAYAAGQFGPLDDPKSKRAAQAIIDRFRKERSDFYRAMTERTMREMNEED